MAECAVYTVSSNSLDLNLKSVFTCKLCLTDCTILDMYTLRGCRCHFCTMCIQQYLTVMIMEGSVLSLTCPDGQCPTLGEIKEHEIQTLVDPQLFERYKRIKFLREVDLDPNRTFCPTVRCENVCRIQPVEMEEMTQFAPRAITCSKCSTVFCSVCKGAWHPEQTCDEAMRSSGRKEDEGIPFNSTEDSDIKRCPLCHVPIERNDGCAQMMCKQCKHVFCWYCLESLDDDFLLRHYDSGPCKNKLGHSRASIAWHRAQVVGIFAGFGLLLLVASPILLLAAPCILCCKCNLCNCCDDEGETDTIPYT